MNVNEVISSGLLESYVLGATTAEETALVLDLCHKHPELLKEIESIELALINYASQNTKPLDKHLKETIDSSLGFTGPADSAKIIAMQPSSSSLNYYKFGIAASVLLLIGSGAYIFELQRKLEKLNGEVAELSASKSFLADELKIQQTSLTEITGQFQIISNPEVKTIALKGMNSLATKSALVHWNQETNEVYFNASSLPAHVNKQYQLWAIIDGKPVDAGIIDLQNSTTFQKMKLIKGATAFAVTVEAIGGSSSPSLDTMCLLGNV